MSILLRLSALCIISSILLALLRPREPQLALVLTLCVMLCTLFAIWPVAVETFQFATLLAERTGLRGELFATFLRVLLIGVVTRIGSAFCRDAVQSAFAELLELAGGICTLICLRPLLQDVMKVLEVWV